MRIFFILTLLFVTFFGCIDDSTKTKMPTRHISTNQNQLLEMLERFKFEFNAGKSQSDKDSIKDEYALKFKHFLIDSLGYYIDSMAVTVDTIIQTNWFVTSQFHTGEIEFKFGMRYKEGMDPRNDSEYHFVTSLKPQSEVLLNFVTLGAIELNDPNERNKRTLRIFAFPQKLQARPK